MTRLFRGQQPYLTALLTLAGLGLSGWHLHFSRLGFRAILLPLLTALAFYFFWRGLAYPHRRSAIILSAVFLSLAIYAYLAARLLPFVILGFLLLSWLTKRITKQHFLFLTRSLFLTLFFLLLPLIIYFVMNPADFLARAATVSIFNPEWNKGDLIGTFWQSLTLTLGTFFGLTGDPNPLVNLPNQPALPLILVPFFVLGLGSAMFQLYHQVVHAFRPGQYPQPGSGPAPSAPLLLLCWWSIMLLPAILAPEGAPHHLRLIGTMIPTYAFVALGIVLILNPLLRTTHHGRRLLIYLLPSICYLLLGWQTYTDYFTRWPDSVDFTLPFDLYAERLAGDIAQAPPEAVYILPMDIRAAAEARHYTVDYLLGVPEPAREGGDRLPYIYIPVDERNAETLLNQASTGRDELRVVRWREDKHQEADAKELITFLLETTAQPVDRKAFPVYDLETYLLAQPADGACGATGQLIRAECEPGSFKLPAIDWPVNANFDNLLQLEAAFTPPAVAPGDWLPVALTLAPLGPMTADYKVSLRLLNEAGERIVQKDRVLLHDFHQGTSLWPAEKVNEYYLLPVPPELPAGTYRVTVVIYEPETLAPLVADGQAEVPLGRVEIGP
jgi:hypothetical protein